MCEENKRSFLSYLSLTLARLKVIDDEKKTQELESKKAGKNGDFNGAAWDAPYPEGVKKHKIHTPAELPENKVNSGEDEEEKNNGEFR